MKADRQATAVWTLLSCFRYALLAAILIYPVLIVWQVARDSYQDYATELDKLAGDRQQLIDRIADKTTHIQNRWQEIVDLDGRIAALKAEEEALWWWELWDRGQLRTKRLPLEKTREALDTTRKALESEVSLAESQMRELEEGVERQGMTVWGRLSHTFGRTWLQGVYASAGIVAGACLWRVLWYLLAGRAQKMMPLQVVRAANQGKARVTTHRRGWEITPSADEVLYVRQHWVACTPAQRRHDWVLTWPGCGALRAYSAGLRRMRVVRSEAGAFTLSVPSAAELEIVEIDLCEHPGLVYHPSSLIAVAHAEAGLKLRTVWRLFHLQSWCTRQFRYFVFEGTGRVILHADGGARTKALSGTTDVFDHAALMAYEGWLALGCSRACTFLGYLAGGTLLRCTLSGEGTYVHSLAHMKDLEKPTVPRGGTAEVVTEIGGSLVG